MNDFDKLLKEVDDKTLDLTDEIKDLLGTELYLGQSNYVCKYGTLSDGFEKLTPAQRYYQAIKECWTYTNNIRETRCFVVECQATIRVFKLKKRFLGWIPIYKDIIDSKIMLQMQRLTNLLVTIQDQLRIVKAFDEERKSLMPEVRSKYKNIEESEPDSWEAVLKYRIARQKTGNKEHLNHVPLPQEKKARIGMETGAPDAFFWLMIDREDEINKLSGGDLKKYMELKGIANEKGEVEWQKSTGSISGAEIREITQA